MSPKYINRLFLLSTAPFIGMALWLFMTNITFSLHLSNPKPVPNLKFSVHSQIEQNNKKLNVAQNNTIFILSSIQKFYSIYEKTTSEVGSLLALSISQAQRPEIIYDHRITSFLGTPARTIDTNKIRLQLFYLNDPKYHSYALKVDLKSKDAMKLVLGKDTLGDSETTLQAVDRYHAIAGVNAGGFADAGSKRYPLENTIINGKFAYGFFPSKNDLSFIGFDQNMKLIGGMFFHKSDLDQLHPKFGATFVPILLQDGQKQDIPHKWLVSPKRAPRTVVGNYKDNQILYFITDGYNENGSSGATLPELQNKLLGFGIQDAYNLDGGGSSSLIFNGQVINHPSDGKLRKVATNFLFFK